MAAAHLPPARCLASDSALSSRMQLLPLRGTLASACLQEGIQDAPSHPEATIFLKKTSPSSAFQPMRPFLPTTTCASLHTCAKPHRLHLMGFKTHSHRAIERTPHEVAQRVAVTCLEMQPLLAASRQLAGRAGARSPDVSSWDKKPAGC